MSEANLNAFALKNGIHATCSQMDQASQSMLRYKYLMSVTRNAQGDFARTSNSWANQIRLLQLNFKTLMSTLGQGFIAVLTPVISLLNQLISKLLIVAQAVGSVFAKLGLKSKAGSGGVKSLGTNLNSIGSGANNAVSGLGNVGNAADKAGKKADAAAKKMQKLMGFDEINTLSKDDKSSGSGSGTGSGAGAGGLDGIGGSDFETPNIDDSKTVDSLNKLKDDVSKVLTDLLKPLQKAWNNYGKWFLSKWEYFKDRFHYCCQELQKFLQSVWTHGGEEFVQHMAEIGLAVAGTALKIGGDILNALGNLWKHLDPASNPYTQAFINAMNKLAVSVRDFIISAGNWFGQFMNLGGQAFINTIGDIVMIVGTTLAETLADCITWIKSFMNSWAGHLLIKTTALALNIVAGIIKALAIVIEKCHKVLSVFLLLWSAWKFTQVIKGIGDTSTKLGGLVAKIVVFGSRIKDNIVQCAKWYKSIGTDCVKGIRDFKTHLNNAKDNIMAFGSKIKGSITGIINFAKSLATNAVQGLKNFGMSVKNGLIAVKDFIVGLKESIVAFVQSKVAMITATAAEKGMTVAQLALNTALKLCPIIAIVSAIALLVTAVVKIGEKFGWWTKLSEWLNEKLGWLVEGVAGLWDKVKSFFGWDETPACEASMDEIGTKAEDTGATIEQAFGKSSSAANQYLNSIHFNSASLAEEVNKATESANQKFGMLSQNAQQYLDAIKSKNTDTLNQMGADQGKYNSEIKAMYSDLTEAEKNEFLKKYGIIKGINDNYMNYEGLSYQQRVARNAAFIAQIEQDDTLSYQQKKAKIDEMNRKVQESINQEKTKYEQMIKDKESELRGLLATHSNVTEEGKKREKSLRDTIERYQKHITAISGQESNKQVTNKQQADQAIQKSAQTTKDKASDEYKNMTKDCKAALNDLNKAIADNSKKISTISVSGKNCASNIRKSFNGLGSTLAKEFDTFKSKSINSFQSMVRTMNTALSYLKFDMARTISALGSGVTRAFNNITTGLRSANRDMSFEYNRMSSATNNCTSNLKSRFYNCFRDIRWRVGGELSSLRRQINNFSATLRVKIPHFYMYGNFNPEYHEVPTVGVSYYARGGIVNKATNAIIGEAGQEAVVPLENHTEWMDKIAVRLASALVKDNGGSDNNKPIAIQVVLDGRVVSESVVKNINEATKSTGTCPINF